LKNGDEFDANTSRGLDGRKAAESLKGRDSALPCYPTPEGRRRRSQVAQSVCRSHSAVRIRISVRFLLAPPIDGGWSRLRAGGNRKAAESQPERLCAAPLDVSPPHPPRRGPPSPPRGRGQVSRVENSLQVSTTPGREESFPALFVLNPRPKWGRDSFSSAPAEQPHEFQPSPPWGRGWAGAGVFTSRGGPGEGVQGERSVCAVHTLRFVI
jgi:hypothetical protein